MAFKIGNIELKERVILAPMAGVTSFSYRKFMRPFGCGITYTEMISDCGLIYDNKRTRQMIYSDGSDRPLAIQLFGGDKETLLKGVELLESSGIEYDILDLNFACPVPKVTKNNGGSSWLLDLDKLYDTTKAIVEKSTKPVSAKIRLGYNEVNVDETVKVLQDAGVSFIMIHARTRKELYTGKPHFDLLKNVRDILHIPFGVSGNIYTVKDALDALEITRADAILVARGGIGNPNLIRNINLALEGKEYDETLKFNEQKDYLFTFTDLLIKEKGETRAISILKGLAPKFFPSPMPHSKELRQELTLNMKCRNDMENILNEYEKKFAEVY